MSIHMDVPTTFLFMAGLAIAVNAVSVPAQETLGSLATQRGVYVGAAVGSAFWGADDRYQSTLKEFNVIVAENAMKFSSLEPTRNHFTWQQGDDLAAFAAANGMALRGHNLVWHQQSDWVANAAAGLSRIEMLAILKNHIDSVVGHFRGKILEWDVVNEAVDDGTGGLRNSFWRQRIGDDYLDSAFTWAHRADPQALLFYNDYSGEGMDGKADKIYDLAKGLKARGIPIDGVGLQSHFTNDNDFSTVDIDRNLKRLAASGLRAAFTEVDFRLALPVDSASLALQKRNYSKLLAVCLANANCKTFLTWGFTDAYSWVPGFFPGFGSALPFDQNYQPKPAYAGIKETLAAAPTAINLIRRGKTHSNGNVTPRGNPGNSGFSSPGFSGASWRDALGKWLGGP
jgi:endo-1,4-beta-xylanase